MWVHHRKVDNFRIRSDQMIDLLDVLLKLKIFAYAYQLGRRFRTIISKVRLAVGTRKSCSFRALMVLFWRGFIYKFMISNSS